MKQFKLILFLSVIIFSQNAIGQNSRITVEGIARLNIYVT